MTDEGAPGGQRETDGDGGLDLELDLGFTLGLEMDFESTVRWAADEGLDFVELLLDGPYARERIEDRTEKMRALLETTGVGVVVHLPFAADPGSPFALVREGAVAELVAGMDIAADLGAEPVVFHPSSDAWDPGWSGTATLEVGTEDCDTIARGRRHVEVLFGD